MNNSRNKVISAALLAAALSLGALAQLHNAPHSAHGAATPGAANPAHPSSQLGADTPTVQTSAPELRVDQTLAMRVPYTPSQTLTDDYRCFLLDPGLNEDRDLEGFEVIPGNPETVHHVIVNQITAEQAAEARVKDGADGRPGWSCFGGTGLRAGSLSAPAAGAGSAARPAPTLQALLPALQAAGVDTGKLLRASLGAGGDLMKTLAAYGQAGGDTAALLAALGDAGLFGGSQNSSQDALGNAIGNVFGIGSWVPGAQATVFPAGTGRRLARGNLLVMQVHYNTLAGRDPDVTRMHLQYAPRGAALTPLRGLSLVAPVEIPCPAGAQGDLCNRDAVIARNVKEDGPRATRLVQGVMALCGKTLKDYAGQNGAAARSSCDQRVRQDAQAVGVTFHMHTLGMSGVVTLNPGTPREQVLLDIPDWDFHWQGNYWYEQPISLKKGDVLRVECTWNNTRNASPRYVVWGEGTQDEMCLAGLTVMDAPTQPAQP
jgi:Copper type II ascorbate-dependent monooxygenase, C-terminal domain